MKKWILVLCLFLTACTSNKTVVDNSPKIYIHQLTNQSHIQMESYVITTSTGECYVVDGGTAEDEGYLINYIIEHDDDATVDGWFLTHYHKDHTGALAAFLNGGSTEITVNQIYCNFPEEASVVSYDPTRVKDYETITNALASQTNVTTVQENDQVTSDMLTITVVNNMQEFENNFGNNSSTCYLFKSDTTSCLFLGDCGTELSDYLLANKKDMISNIDYVQVAHHGQQGATKELYETVQPKVCLWPTTDWIISNNNGTADLKFDETYAMFDDIKHTDYFASDGTQVIEMK